MPSLTLLSDTELLARIPAIVQAERVASADVVEHLMEVQRRRLYLEQACSSLYTYCRERLNYSEDAALKRARVAHLALRLPEVLDELRSGAIHLTGLFLLERYLNNENAEELLTLARGMSRRELEKMLAIRFPRPDVPSKIEALDGAAGDATGGSHREAPSGPSPWFTCPEADAGAARGRSNPGDSRSRLEPLSAERYRVEFTASAALRAKIEQARELTSHALPRRAKRASEASGGPGGTEGPLRGGRRGRRRTDLALLFERALDELIERELKRRLGAGKPGRVAKRRPDSRHVPLTLARQVWERDGSQCTFVDSTGRRCQERRFLTLEHRHPFSLGGPDTLENLCLLCKAHNSHTARRVFGDAFIAGKVTARETHTASADDVERSRTSEIAGKMATDSDVFEKVRSALTNMGFPPRAVTSTLTRLHRDQPGLQVEPLLRAALSLLTPHPSFSSRRRVIAGAGRGASGRRSWHHRARPVQT